MREAATKLSIVLSVQPAAFQAATFKGELEANLSRIAGLGYDGVELAIRDPSLVDADALQAGRAPDRTARRHLLFAPGVLRVPLGHVGGAEDERRSRHGIFL